MPTDSIGLAAAGSSIGFIVGSILGVLVLTCLAVVVGLNVAVCCYIVTASTRRKRTSPTNVVGTNNPAFLLVPTKDKVDESTAMPPTSLKKSSEEMKSSEETANEKEREAMEEERYQPQEAIFAHSEEAEGTA